MSYDKVKKKNSWNVVEENIKWIEKFYFNFNFWISLFWKHELVKEYLIL